MLNTPITNEYVQNLLEGLSGQLKGNLQPVQHQGQDPTNTREIAVKAMKKQIDDAKKSGKDVIYRVEGRDEEHQAGDPETEDRIRAYAKKQGVNYEEGSLEGEVKAGGKKIQKIAKSYDPKKGDYRAFPEDDPTGKTKPNEISRGVERWNAGRRREMRKIIQKDLDSGKVVIGTLGAGHFNQPR